MAKPISTFRQLIRPGFCTYCSLGFCLYICYSTVREYMDDSYDMPNSLKLFGMPGVYPAYIVVHVTQSMVGGLFVFAIGILVVYGIIGILADIIIRPVLTELQQEFRPKAADNSHRPWSHAFGCAAVLISSLIFGLALIPSYLKGGPPNVVESVLLVMIYSLFSSLVYWLFAHPR